MVGLWLESESINKASPEYFACDCESRDSSAFYYSTNAIFFDDNESEIRFMWAGNGFFVWFCFVVKSVVVYFLGDDDLTYHTHIVCGKKDT